MRTTRTRRSENRSETGWSEWLAWLPAASFALAAVWFGSALDGYSHAVHPVALLGAQGIPNAVAFDAFGFVVPGLASAGFAWRLRARIATAGWGARIGAQLAWIAALAFAAQGVLPLDPTDLDAAASRQHASAWTLWWIAFVAGAALLAAGLRKSDERRVLAWASAGLRKSDERRVLAWASAAAAIGVLLLAASPWPLLPPAIGQRTAFAIWLLWVTLAARQR